MSTVISGEYGRFYKAEKFENYNILSKQMGSYHGFMDILVNDVVEWKRNNNRVVILAGTRARGEKLRDELISNNIEAVYIDEKI